MVGLPADIIEVVEREQAQESEPWLFITKDIAGQEVVNLNLRHVLILDGIRNPVLEGKGIDVDDLAQFLWVVSAKFELGNTKARDKFVNEIASIEYIKLLEGTKIYVEDALAQSRAMESSTESRNEKPNAHFVAYVIDTFASTYGWGIEYILDLPLAIIHQLVAVINERVSASNEEKYTITKESEKLINRHIRKQLKE